MASRAAAPGRIPLAETPRHRPRAAERGDHVRGFKMLCNPVVPASFLSSFEPAIFGLKSFCDGFRKAPGTVDGIRRHVETHDLAGARAPNDSTLVVRLTHSVSDILQLLCYPSPSPIAVEDLDYLPDGLEYRRHMRSDGPYELAAYEPGRHYALRRNAAWDAASDPLRPAYVDSIDIVGGVASNAVFRQIQAGTIDLADNITAGVDLFAASAERYPGLRLGPPGDNYPLAQFLFLNHAGSQAALRDPRVRKAIAWAVDRRAVAQLSGGAAFAKPLTQAATAGGTGHAVGHAPFGSDDAGPDIARAKQLLAEAGRPGGLTLDLMYDQTLERQAQALHAALGKAGIMLRLHTLRSDEISARISRASTVAGSWDLYFTTWIWGWMGNNGRTYMGLMLQSTSENNYSRYSSAVLDRAIDDAIGATSVAGADSGWRRAAMLAMEDAAAVPVIQLKSYVLHSPRVRNCVFWYAWLGGASCDLRQLSVDR